MDLAEASNLRGKIKGMFGGDHINSTEDRAVLHTATRARRDQVGPAAVPTRARGRRGHRPPRGGGGENQGAPQGACRERRGGRRTAPANRARHYAAPPGCGPGRPSVQVVKTDGKDVVPEVWEVLDKIRVFTEKVGGRPAV
jgi:glucose-6-phosphate isomerase